MSGSVHYLYGDGDIELAAGRATIEVRVTNTGDRAVQVGSHYHFFEANRELRFDRLGVFRYSREEGTPAAELPGQMPEEVKQARWDAVMRLQAAISEELCREQIGQTVRVIVDGRDETGLLAGRTMGQAPEIDGVTYISSKKDLTPGTFHDVLIKDAREYDLLGEIV